ncbi:MULTISPECIES: arsinothricin resistance N-acetyltransferase ArsN1 family A [Paenibacillus]|jgi:L-amino acid N-acyltransferase YncA|uniref:GCN5 family acetyltransferase n=1 Tax=Paenibacillus glucanolyticus TaxID=59843 RepID=A0A168EVS7_9BACL|nr:MULTISPECIES: arsinothricin resistance N-acetyltransferase ArsN1 family A [Paenibacillus]MCA4754203.1 N-acetyltransferase [Mycolicibacterium fortuitum]ETT40432.1 phosphinothricin acetyltransferase [Paenibacillus sp. FSL R5-808]KZS44878.1 GCN5 family acetyltransferase [Paenibacillus glucanolyticus]MDH6671075.1 L-amino acid N-acyltransferase YncA [Paenibacillus sp. LBL]OMF70185.1 GNAT family N-acetyltransferase [Paenibacillus glucanolyticus]
MKTTSIRAAVTDDVERILNIYNQGIEDRIATLEVDQKDIAYMNNWFQQHQNRYAVIVAEYEDVVIGWASLNPFSQRCAYDGVADLSIYIDRAFRGKGIGSILLQRLEEIAKEKDFYKIVLFTFPFNQNGQGLYHKLGYRDVGVFEKQGVLDGRYVDVKIMEKLINIKKPKAFLQC